MLNILLKSVIFYNHKNEYDNDDFYRKPIKVCIVSCDLSNPHFIEVDFSKNREMYRELSDIITDHLKEKYGATNDAIVDIAEYYLAKKTYKSMRKLYEKMSGGKKNGIKKDKTFTCSLGYVESVFETSEDIDDVKKRLKIALRNEIDYFSEVIDIENNDESDDE